MRTCERCGTSLPDAGAACARCAAGAAGAVAERPSVIPVAAAALAPKEAAGAEQTGSYRRPGGPWSKGDGKGAKVIALRPPGASGDAGGARPPDAVPSATRAREAPAPDAPDAQGTGGQATGEQAERPGASRAAGGERNAAAAGESAPTDVDTASRAARLAAGAAGPLDATRRESTGAHTTTGSGTAARRPPVLASESLREHIAPTEPGRRAMRVLATALGLGGAAAVLALGGATAVPLIGASGLALVAAAGVAPLRYRDRAVIVLGFSLPLLLLHVLGEASSTGAARHGALLGLGVAGLSGALFFRAEHRASRVARVLVGVGIAACATWMAVSGVLASAVVRSWHWQAWVPAALAVSLVGLLCLSLLAFMAPSSGGGCRAWGASLLGWYALALGAWVTAAAWPGGGAAAAAGASAGGAGGAGTADALRSGATSAVGAAVSATLVALAMSQVLASVSARQRPGEGGRGPQPPPP